MVVIMVNDQGSAVVFAVAVVGRGLTTVVGHVEALDSIHILPATR